MGVVEHQHGSCPNAQFGKFGMGAVSPSMENTLSVTSRVRFCVFHQVRRVFDVAVPVDGDSERANRVPSMIRRVIEFVGDQPGPSSEGGQHGQIGCVASREHQRSLGTRHPATN